MAFISKKVEFHPELQSSTALKVDADLAFFKCTARHTRKIGLEDL